MTRRNEDIERVEGVDKISVASTIIPKQAGHETSTGTWVYKQAGGTVKYYTPEGGDATYATLIDEELAGTGERLVAVDANGQFIEATTLGELEIDYEDFNTILSDPAYKEGRFFYDSVNKTMAYYSDIEGPIGQVMQEVWKRVKNDTASIILDGKVCYVSGDDGTVSTVALAKADVAETCTGTIGFATHDIGIGEEGWVTLLGAVRGLVTTGTTSGTVIHLSDIVAGDWQEESPSSPSYHIKLGTIAIEGASGSIDVHVEVGDNQQDLIKYYNGAFLSDRIVTAGSTDGLTVTVTLECPSGPSCYLFFDGEIIEVDTTPALSVNLTAGTDAVPIRNYVYILSSDPTQLVASTVGFPTAEHARICDTLVQSPADVLANEVYKQHEWTDHLTSSSQQGHSSDLNFWIRQQHATYLSGFGVTISGTGTGTIGLANTIGNALQLHEHTFPVFADPARVLIVNDETTNYTPVTNLGITTDTTGASLNNKTFACILWAVVSEEDAQCKWMMNKPNGSYNNADDARNDGSGFANYSIPDSFRGCGILIHRLVMKLAGGVYTVYLDDSDDLRGQMPNTTAGGSVGAGAQNLTQVIQTGPDASNLDITNVGSLTLGDAETTGTDGFFAASTATGRTVVTGDGITMSAFGGGQPLAINGGDFINLNNDVTVTGDLTVSTGQTIIWDDVYKMRGSAGVPTPTTGYLNELLTVSDGLSAQTNATTGQVNISALGLASETYVDDALDIIAEDTESDLNAGVFLQTGTRRTQGANLLTNAPTPTVTTRRLALTTKQGSVYTTQTAMSLMTTTTEVPQMWIRSFLNTSVAGVPWREVTTKTKTSFDVTGATSVSMGTQRSFYTPFGVDVNFVFTVSATVTSIGNIPLVTRPDDTKYNVIISNTDVTGDVLGGSLSSSGDIVSRGDLVTGKTYLCGLHFIQ